MSVPLIKAFSKSTISCNFTNIFDFVINQKAVKPFFIKMILDFKFAKRASTKSVKFSGRIPILM